MFNNVYVDPTSVELCIVCASSVEAFMDVLTYFTPTQERIFPKIELQEWQRHNVPVRISYIDLVKLVNTLFLELISFNIYSHMT